LMLLRSTKYPRPRKDGNGYTKSIDSGQDLWAQELISQVPDCGSLPHARKLALGNLDEYSKMLVATVAVAAEAVKKFGGDSREQARNFDNLSGLFHHGYPSLIRSNLLMHGWAKRFRRLTPEDVEEKNKKRKVK